MLTAGSVAVFLAGRPFWAAVQRWLARTVLAGLAVRMGLDTGRRQRPHKPSSSSPAPDRRLQAPVESG